MDFSTFTDDCLLAIFSELPLEYRLSTVPLVCRRWALLQTLVRREVTSVTLLSGDSSNADYYRLKSPFHLVDKRTLVTESPDLLQLSSFPDTADDVVDRFQTELPNIRRLTIVQVNQKPSALQPELLSAVEAYAGQLTSFAFYFQFKSLFSELSVRARNLFYAIHNEKMALRTNHTCSSKEKCLDFSVTISLQEF